MFNANSEKQCLLETIKNIPGKWIIYQNSEQGFLKLNDVYVDTLIWICPWANSILKTFDYVQLDASFKLTKPACYSIPLMIKKNRSIPIGLSVALSEKAELYERFFVNIPDIKSLSNLCDLGKALEKTCDDFNFKRFLCHRHLIELFNYNTLTGFLITRICRCKSEESYYNFMKFWIPILNNIIKNNRNPKNLDKFLHYLGYEYDKTKETLVEVHPEVKDQWAIWKRGPINTCSNAVEGRHSHINSLIRKGNWGMENRIRTLIKYIIDSYLNFDQYTGHSLYNHMYSLSKKADILIENGESEKKFSNINCNCPSKKYYECMFGTIDADCIHTCHNKERKRKTPEINLEQIEIEETEIYFVNSDIKWPLDSNKNKSIKKRLQMNSIDLDEEDPWTATNIYMLNAIHEMLPDVDMNFAFLQMMEIYHTLRSEPIYSNFNENSDELLAEWRNRVFLSIFPDNE